MAFRVRPATTLVLVLVVAFTFQLLAVISVPVTKKIYLSEYQDYTFGVFGLCYNGTTCSSVGIGYSASDIDTLQGFTLPSNARHSVSKLLIVHPIATGFTLFLLIGAFTLHWHGPSSSLRFLFFLLLWTIPTFLLALLSFLVDILLFIPHLNWGGWIVLAAAVLIALCAIFLCMMRRTISSRKNMKKIGRTNTFDNNDYQLRPLNYGIGTVDELKNGSDEEDESKPFVHDTTYNTSYFNDDQDDLNNKPTQIYNTMNTDSPAISSSHYDNPNILTPVAASYRGYEDINNSNNVVYDYNHEPSAPPIPESVPYPLDTNLDSPVSNTPYPTSEPYILNTPTSSLKPSGPRPMPGSQDSLVANEFEFEDNTDTIVSRQPTFRTKIAQTLNDLQPEGMYSNSSIEGTSENLLTGKSSNLRDIVEFDSDEDSEVHEASSSVYSSKLPSVIESQAPTPTDRTFPTNSLSYQAQQRAYQQFSSIPQGITVDKKPSNGEYALPDPNDKRTTPTPSFTNDSLLSSTFTSVSQREINPRYLEKNNPEEYRKYLQQQLQKKAELSQLSKENILLESNPDFSIASSPRKR